MNKPKDPLEALPLLAALPAQARAQLLRHATVHTVGAGTVIFQQGDLPTFQQVLLSGSVHLLGHSAQHREVMIEAIEPPDLLTPAAVVMQAPYLLTARAPEKSQLLLIQADAFREAVMKQPLLAGEVVASLAAQFRRMLRQIKNLKLRSGTERVGCYLVALAARQKNNGTVTLPYEKNLIASELGMTPESLSRALAALRQEGIEVRGEQVFIENVPRLAERVGVDPLIDDAEVVQRLWTKSGSAKKARPTGSTARRKGRRVTA